jgi:hypothetical protein
MIHNISDVALRSAIKIDPNGAYQKQMAQQKAQEARQRRPVENADGGGKSEPRGAQDSERTSKYVLEEKTLVFEKYNRGGDLVYRLPPSKKPLDERV